MEIFYEFIKQARLVLVSGLAEKLNELIAPISLSENNLRKNVNILYEGAIVVLLG